MTPALKPGDPVAVYDGGIRRVAAVDGIGIGEYQGQVRVLFKTGMLDWVHPKQVRRLVPRKQREWKGHWVRQFTNTGKVEHVFRPESSISFPEQITPMTLREVRRKPKEHR